MKFLSAILLFAAYVLIYSAVAAGGKFATEPWASLFADAYATPDGSRIPLPGQNENVPGGIPVNPQGQEMRTKYPRPRLGYGQTGRVPG